ncbi:MAG TPA: hypothetical protein VFK28_08350 [Sphingomicrobium sp.]|jgi:hypothetical protein|nr:hypothetical protein [Sphingomicrobium sp.]
MILRRLTANLRAQNWTAIAIEFVIVVLGVFIGTQVANWNQARLEKQSTRRMLLQLVPELQAELQFFANIEDYYRTTRRYADQAAAGWNGGRMTDSEFVIAVYQSSQINGIGINPDSWSLTFGGEQLRNIQDPNVRRNLEVVLTSDYGPVEFNAVATPYREQVRHIIPIEIQDEIRRACGDHNMKSNYGIYLPVLPRSCALKLDPVKAAATAAALRAQPQLAGELRWHLAEIATFLSNAETLALPMRALQRQLSIAS